MFLQDLISAHLKSLVFVRHHKSQLIFLVNKMFLDVEDGGLILGVAFLQLIGC
jgi:hypothetical protein